MTFPTFLRHITLATRDPEATAAFFQATFDWPHVRTPDNAPMATRWLAMGPGQELHLVYKEDFEISTHEEEFGRHFALSCPIGEFDALKERLVAHGAELVDPRRDTPFERFFFQTPDGYIFEIIEAEKFRDEIDQLFEDKKQS